MIPRVVAVSGAIFGDFIVAQRSPLGKGCRGVIPPRTNEQTQTTKEDTMNINSIARSASAQWLNRTIAVVGTVLIAGAIALGLANAASMLVVPVAVPASNMSPAS